LQAIWIQLIDLACEYTGSFLADLLLALLRKSKASFASS
jgi:hypothetical protein